MSWRPGRWAVRSSQVLRSWALPSLLLLVGCSSYQSRTYQIVVKNDSTKTIIPWLTKNGPAYEPGWESPEQIAIAAPAADEPYPFLPVPPGKTAEIPRISGQFARGVDAVLRIYIGPTTLDQILAMNRDSASRIEVVLRPGKNNLVVTDEGPTIKVDRAAP
jgi:hypothetical protein